MELKITPEDLVPDFNRRLLECTTNLIAHTANGATEAAEAWRRAAEAMVEVGKACERINAKLATLTVDYTAPIKTVGSGRNENAEAWVRLTLYAERLTAEELPSRATAFGFDHATIKGTIQRLIARGEVEVATDRTLGLRAQEVGG